MFYMMFVVVHAMFYYCCERPYQRKQGLEPNCTYAFNMIFVAPMSSVYYGDGYCWYMLDVVLIYAMGGIIFMIDDDMTATQLIIVVHTFGFCFWFMAVSCTNGCCRCPRFTEPIPALRQECY